MSRSSESQVGPPSEKTEQNIRDARTYEFWIGPYHVEWKPWVGWVELFEAESGEIQVKCWFWKPRKITVNTEFWFEGPVRWVKIYWLSFGVSALRRLPERRKRWRERMGLEYGRRRFDATERRTYERPYRDIPGLEELERRRKEPIDGRSST